MSTDRTGRWIKPAHCERYPILSTPTSRSLEETGSVVSYTNTPRSHPQVSGLARDDAPS
ncbi:MAG: hypothetical protein JWQ95_1466 [Sphaerisporangium sp.]|nr:hypothetical protein [Sphaerisporangium sp.]